MKSCLVHGSIIARAPGKRHRSRAD
jgi:hypothetical protein